MVTNEWRLSTAEIRREKSHRRACSVMGGGSGVQPFWTIVQRRYQAECQRKSTRELLPIGSQLRDFVTNRKSTREFVANRKSTRSLLPMPIPISSHQTVTLPMPIPISSQMVTLLQKPRLNQSQSSEPSRINS